MTAIMNIIQILVITVLAAIPIVAIMVILYDINKGQKTVNQNADTLNNIIKRVIKLEEDHSYLLEVLEKQNEVIRRLNKRLEGCETIMFPHKYTVITDQAPEKTSHD